MHYVKIFDSILHSSVWAESPATRCVWLTLLVGSDREGRLRASTSGLARAANVSLDECKAALEVLQAPDLDSKDQSYGGRRVERLPEGGWIVLNKQRYRDLQTEEQAAWAGQKRRQRGGVSGGRPRTSPDTSSVSVSTTRMKNEESADVPGRPDPEALAELRRIGEESRRAAAHSERQFPALSP